MPVVPDEEEAPQPLSARVTRAVVEPVRHNRIPAALAVAAGAGSLAPDPFGVMVAAVLVAAAWDAGRKR